MIYTSADIADVIYDLFITEHYEQITVNDVWKAIGHDAILKHPNGTMGGGFRIALGRGLIEKTGRYVTSTHPSRKRGAVAVWRRRRRAW